MIAPKMNIGTTIPYKEGFPVQKGYWTKKETDFQMIPRKYNMTLECNYQLANWIMKEVIACEEEDQG